MDKEFKLTMEFWAMDTESKWCNIIQFTPTLSVVKSPQGHHISSVWYHGKAQHLLLTAAEKGLTNFHSHTFTKPKSWHKIEVIPFITGRF